ncbi:biotin synthase [Hydrogenimonas cancrithermarum]|uniref:Biotin synthase n=1 Tax=Hydrogenimonas cancrithermarum TaxID=2993563 RepID=A0ABN6WXN8_9BACT|nr:biotin synthase [Hydrogenimonas cancrithermarum]BDY12857.1 biotin synthase [Hydrogenimonas cancrithermarum]BDY12974.1 biotin synthase [Hydrogenimonas cancrithermarum]
MSKKVFLCAISNISSGHCLEDCKFCTQSVKYGAKIERFYHKPIDTIVEEAKLAKARQAIGFCLVTAGKGIDEKTLRFVCEAAEAVKKEVEDLNLIACNGTANTEQLRTLKDHGIDSYNHNLETSERFYPQICTTHGWKERFETCENVKKVGLKLCTGGIFGLGESMDDRLSMLESIASLDPESVPINFYHPNVALPLEGRTLPMEEALKMIETARRMLGDRRIMVAGGREITFGDEDYRIFEAGANAIVIGNYLTTQGKDPMRDHAMLQKHGYEIAASCNDK